MEVPEISPEELQEEQESLEEVKDEKIRASVAEALGLADDDDNKDILDRAVEREKTHRSKFSKVVGQKIKWRDAAKKSEPKSQDEGTGKTLTAEEIRKQTEADIQARFNEEFLEESDFSDAIKSEIRDFAKFKNISARKASQAAHIKSMIDAEKKNKRNDEAGENGNGEGPSGKDKSEGMPKEFNDPKYMMTEEGRQAYDAWEKGKKK